ncbi:hepatic leukemia factor isoform X2 [Coregonus clupeaformis]|uniref:hepatic leukemia factor isoform X2 n=1 Tax=Coregonus clupeaformis TaxID=59861 RepID=UPI001BE0DFDE|nr:hepatic leukemia factor isoform X2 [Coregonus clupeaformis]
MDKIMSRHLPVNPSFLPASNHCVLKSLLENPMKLPFLKHEQQHAGFEKEREKEKNLDEERSAPQSAFLGPTLWNKTLTYDEDNFQLEYMDLDEFLSENGIPSELATAIHCDQHQSQQSQSQHQTSTLPSRNTPSPIDPESIQVPMSYEPDPADLALSSVPGQEMFDPRKRKFAPEELKPQPMFKKARKVLFPDDMKDDRYWVRRKKNNVAAKRSRDARRLKENQIAIRAGFLEKENSALRMELGDLRRELGRTKNIVAKYQATHGPL